MMPGPISRNLDRVSRRSLLSAAAAGILLPACRGTAGPTAIERIVRIDPAALSERCHDEAINHAIERAHDQGGGTVLLDARSYDICAPILLKSRVTLRGRGASRTVLRQSGSSESWSRLPRGAIVSSSNAETHEDVHVRDLAVKGLHRVALSSDARFHARIGIGILNARHSSIEACTVSDTGTGIGFFGSAGSEPHRNLIAGCRVDNASSWVEPGNSGTPRGITMATDHSTVRDCVVTGSHTGYYVATEYGRYENCTARGWRDDGFYVNANHCHLTHCRAIAADSRAEGMGSGFAVNPSHHNLFSHCVALRCPNSGMRFRHAGKTAPTDSRVISCHFSNCGYGFLDDMIGTDPYPDAVARRNEFNGNVAEFSQFCGFLFIRQCDGIVRDNRATSNNQAGISVQNMGAISFADYCLNNVIEGNVCTDPAPQKTQKWGLYVYPKMVTGASIANVGNRIRHRSKDGRDLF